MLQRARHQPRDKPVDLLARHLAGMVFEDTLDAARPQAKCQCVEVAHVAHDRLRVRAHCRIEQRAQHRGGAVSINITAPSKLAALASTAFKRVR